jgi:hypothetical protein
MSCWIQPVATGVEVPLSSLNVWIQPIEKGLGILVSEEVGCDVVFKMRKSLCLREGGLPSFFQGIQEHLPQLAQRETLFLSTSHVTLKMEAASSSKTLVSYCSNTWCHNPKENNLNILNQFMSHLGTADICKTFLHNHKLRFLWPLPLMKAL